MLTRLEMYPNHLWKSTRDQVWEGVEQGSLLHVPEELERRVWGGLAKRVEVQAGDYGVVKDLIFDILWEDANAD